MSIINKMHQDIQSVQQEQPILANMPKKNAKKKILIVSFIVLSIGASLGLSYLIVSQEKVAGRKQEIALISTQLNSISNVNSNNDNRAENKKSQQNITLKTPIVQQQVVEVIPIAPPVKPETTIVKKSSAVIAAPIEKKAVRGESPAVDKNSLSNAPAQRDDSLNQESAKNSSLEITSVTLNKEQLAEIHLKEADKAETQGKLQLAAKKRSQALTLQPQLNEVRKSLALYYYGRGETAKASRLLQAGALISPEYSDFNLMLSRIALKAGDNQKAYLYLEQNPPEVEGHLDYYASHAILAQKFHKYEQAEGLYKRLLSIRPNNGRWLMSLAITQDKQAKLDLAINNYKKALLQTDLSLKAKDYIKQRLTYLEKA